MNDPKTLLSNALAACLEGMGARRPRMPKPAGAPAPVTVPAAVPTPAQVRFRPAPAPVTVLEKPKQYPNETATVEALARLTNELGSPLAAAQYLFGAPDNTAREAA